MELVGSTSLTLSGQCRIRIRSKKWYWPQVVFGIDVSLVNAWMLYRRSRTCSSGVQVLLATPVIDRLRRGGGLSGHIPHSMSNTRYDEMGRSTGMLKSQHREGAESVRSAPKRSVWSAVLACTWSVLHSSTSNTSSDIHATLGTPEKVGQNVTVTEWFVTVQHHGTVLYLSLIWSVHSHLVRTSVHENLNFIPSIEVYNYIIRLQECLTYNVSYWVVERPL